MEFYEVIDRRPSDPDRSSNGGGYAFWRIIAVNGNGCTVGVRFYTSSDFPFCPYCGHFEQEWCDPMDLDATKHDLEGRETGRKLKNEEYTEALTRWNDDLFVTVESQKGDWN